MATLRDSVSIADFCMCGFVLVVSAVFRAACASVALISSVRGAAWRGGMLCVVLSVDRHAVLACQVSSGIRGRVDVWRRSAE